MTTVDLLIFEFPSEKQAAQALDYLRSMKNEKVISILDAALISHDTNGKIHIKETADPGGKQGALFGAVIGTLIGFLGGPVGAVIGAAAGAGVGGFAAQKIDMGIPNDRMKDIADALQPGKSAIVALIEQIWAKQAADEMQKFDANVIRENIREEISSHLVKLGGSEGLESTDTADKQS